MSARIRFSTTRLTLNVTIATTRKMIPVMLSKSLRRREVLKRNVEC
jgi:hypothetical protein